MPPPGAYSGGDRPRRRAEEEEEEEPSKFYFGNLWREGRYSPKHPELFEPDARWEEWLHPNFLRAFREAEKALAGLEEKLRAQDSKGQAAPVARDVLLLRPEGRDAVRSAWSSVLTLECQGGGPGVYSFEAFTPEFCEKLLDEIDYAQAKYSSLLTRPNGMNRYGMVLNQLGLEPAITRLQQRYVQPLQHYLYGREGFAPDDHHCFVVRYSKLEDLGLDMHSDSSDVTLNVCLGRNFAGSTLTFCGIVGNSDHRVQQHVYHHQVGRAVIHLGRQRHGADDLASGERMSLILWNTSKMWRQSDAYFKVMAQRKRAAEAPPDMVCLSYTHDEDFRKFQQPLPKAYAVRRGVMLESVKSDPENQAKWARLGGC